MSSEGMPRNGASRTPALELPTTQAACFMASEKCENRIDGMARKRLLGSASITARISSEPGSLLGKETLRVLKQMPEWTPGKQRGRNVTVRYKMPVKFHLLD